MTKDYIEIGEDNSTNISHKADIKIEKTQKLGKTSIDNREIKLDRNITNLNNSNKNNNKKSKNNEKIDDIKQGKWLVILTIIILAYFIYQPLVGLFMNYLQNNPSLYRIYLFIFSEINNSTIMGLFMVSILGALFFMVLPSEAIFIYYLSSTYYNPVIVVLLVIMGSLVGLSFNYFFGRLLGEGVIKFIFKKNFDKYKNTVNKWGGTFVFLGNIFPGPMEVLSVFFGSFKYNYKKFMLLCALGRLIKYIILFVAFTFFWDAILEYYEDFINLL